MYVNDLGTFVGNIRYHLEEQVEVNRLAPRIGGGSGRRTPSTSANGCDLAATELPSLLRHLLNLFLQRVYNADPPVAWIVVGNY